MATGTWTDDRLNDLARALEPLPVKVAQLDGVTDHLCHDLDALHRDSVGEALKTRDEMAAIQRQLVQMAWALLVAVVTAGAALVAALL